MCSASKAKIMIGSHSVNSNIDTFGHPDDPHFDGIHMYGPLGTSGYTMSILDIHSCVLNITKPLDTIPPKYRNVNSTQSVGPGQWSVKKTKQVTDRRHQNSSPHVSNIPPPSKASVPNGPTSSSTPSVLQYAVKTFNRFSHFLS